jgi:hypothetical protein
MLCVVVRHSNRRVGFSVDKARPKPCARSILHLLIFVLLGALHFTRNECPQCTCRPIHSPSSARLRDHRSWRSRESHPYHILWLIVPKTSSRRCALWTWLLAQATCGCVINDFLLRLAMTPISYPDSSPSHSHLSSDCTHRSSFSHATSNSRLTHEHKNSVLVLSRPPKHPNNSSPSRRP